MLLTVRLDESGFISTMNQTEVLPADPPPYDLSEEWGAWLENENSVVIVDLDPFAHSLTQLDISGEEGAERLLAELDRFLASRSG